MALVVLQAVLWPWRPLGVGVCASANHCSSLFSVRVSTSFSKPAGVHMEIDIAVHLSKSRSVQLKPTCSLVVPADGTFNHYVNTELKALGSVLKHQASAHVSSEPFSPPLFEDLQPLMAAASVAGLSKTHNLWHRLSGLCPCRAEADSDLTQAARAISPCFPRDQ